MLEIDYPRVSLHGSLTRTSGGHSPSYAVQIAERSNDDVHLFVPPYELYPDHRARACPPLIPPYTTLSYRSLSFAVLSYPTLNYPVVQYPIPGCSIISSLLSHPIVTYAVSHPIVSYDTS